MRKSSIVLRCIGKGVLNAVSGGVLGAVFEIAGDTWDALEQESKEAERIAELREIAQASAESMREMVRQTLEEIAAGASESTRQHVGDYLLSVQSQVRRSLRRPSDPGGTTIPVGLRLRTAGDLAGMLPTRLPRFKPGDRPLPGVDLEIVELLGIGGFGEVWRARNPRMHSQEQVALKFCVDEAASSSLRREAALLDRVMSEGQGHPGLVQLKRTYLGATPPCLEYELIEGGDLAGLIQSRHREAGGIPPEMAATMVLRVAAIVGFAHRLSPPIVHRDLKPTNILVRLVPGRDVELKVGDFGIGGLATRDAATSRLLLSTSTRPLTSAHHGSYTPLYASPEQMRGDDPDPRDDVHALGVIWHQLLTGNLSEGVPTGAGWKRNLAGMGMDGRLIDLLESCVEGHASDRPASANHLAASLEALRKPEVTLEPIPEVPRTSPRGVHAATNPEPKTPPSPRPQAQPGEGPRFPPKSPARPPLPTSPPPGPSLPSTSPYRDFGDVPWYRRSDRMLIVMVTGFCCFPLSLFGAYVMLTGPVYTDARDDQGLLKRWSPAQKSIALILPTIQILYLFLFMVGSFRNGFDSSLR